MRSSHAELAARVRCSLAGSLAPRFFLLYSCGALGRTDQIREGEKGEPNGEQILPSAPWHLVSSRGFQRVDICRDITSLLGDGSNLVGGFCLSSRSTCTALFLQDLKQKRERVREKKKKCTANSTLVSHLLLVYSPFVPIRTQPVQIMLIASDRRRSRRECA